jgi:hypothetical protein
VPAEYITGLHVRDRDLLTYLEEATRAEQRALPVRVVREWFS